MVNMAAMINMTAIYGKQGCYDKHGCYNMVNRVARAAWLLWRFKLFP